MMEFIKNPLTRINRFRYRKLSDRYNLAVVVFSFLVAVLQELLLFSVYKAQH